MHCGSARRREIKGAKILFEEIMAENGPNKGHEYKNPSSTNSK